MGFFITFLSLSLELQTVPKIWNNAIIVPAGRGVGDAVVTLMHFLYKHLEGPNTHARLLFADFSTRFNTIQPTLLADGLYNHLKLDLSLISWVLDFSTNSSQCMKVNHVLSDVLGCYLSPLLLILYTNEQCY